MSVNTTTNKGAKKTPSGTSRRPGRGKARSGLGFFLGWLLYIPLFFAIPHPRSAGVGTWVFFALIAIPLLIMLMIGPGGTNGQRYSGNFWAAFWAMAIYTMAGLIRAGVGVQSGGSGAMFATGAVVTVVYGIIAGLVAMGAAMVRTKIQESRGFVHGEAER